MNIFNTYQAKSKLSHLINLSLQGEDVVIAKAGLPLVKLVPVKPKAVEKTSFGSLKANITMSKDFDNTSAEITASFYDNPIEPTP